MNARIVAFAAGLLLLPIGTKLHAQIGIQGGLSLSDLFGGGVESVDSRQGLTGGGVWRFIALGPLEIGPELLYMQKGAEGVQFDGQGAPQFNEFGLDYLEIPVLARLSFPLPFGGGRLRGYGSGGPAWAWRLQCSIRATADGSAALSDGCALPQIQGVDDVVSSADRGAVFNGGLLFEVGSLGVMNIDARMVRGLDRVIPDPAEPEARNRAFSLTVGWDLGVP